MEEGEGGCVANCAQTTFTNSIIPYYNGSASQDRCNCQPPEELRVQRPVDVLWRPPQGCVAGGSLAERVSPQSL